MRILLTGGSGFIGGALRPRLTEGNVVVAPDHSEFDVEDSAEVNRLFSSQRFDVVIHGAAPAGERTLEGTLRGYWNIARHAGSVARIFYFGSGAEYGKHRDLTKVREEEIGTEIPRDSYGLAKFLCNDHARRSDRIVNLRLFGVYGPRERYLFKFISNAVAKAIVGIPIVIRQDVVFDYLWVDDLARVVADLIGNGPSHRDINVTPTESISLVEVVRLIESVLGQHISAETEIRGLNLEYTGDNSRLMGLLPDFRFTSYAEGIRDLLTFWSSRRSEIDAEALRRDDYMARCLTGGLQPVGTRGGRA